MVFTYGMRLYDATTEFTAAGTLIKRLYLTAVDSHIFLVVVVKAFSSPQLYCYHICC